MEGVQKSLILSRLAVFVGGFFRLSLAKLPHIWDNRTLAARPAASGLRGLVAIRTWRPTLPIDRERKPNRDDQVKIDPAQARQRYGAETPVLIRGRGGTVDAE